MKASYGQGRYWVRVLSQAFGKSKNKGTPEFSMRILILGKVNVENPDGDLVRCDQNERYIFIYITEGTAEFVIDDLARIGYDKPSFKFLNSGVPGHFDFTNREFEAFCEHEEYEGKTKEKWRIAKPRNHIESAPLDDKEVRQLDSLFGKQLAKLGKPVAKAPAPPAREDGELVGVSPEQRSNAGTGRADPTAPPTEEEIPF